MKVFPGITLFKGTCNTYYIKGKTKVLIDAGFLVRQPIDMIVLTHCHCDHIYYLAELVEMHKCKVACGWRDKNAIETLGEETISWLCGKELKPVRVDLALKEGDILDLGNMKLEVLEVPGHTPGSIALFDKEHGILFSGDTLFEDSIGRWDLPGGNKEELEKSVARLSALKARLFPGH